MPELKNVDWRKVQSRLKALGFDPGKIDGERGPRTDRAITEFKRSIGFQARPFYGPLTHAALGFHAVRTNELYARPAETLPWLEVFDRVRGMHEVRNNGALRRFLASDGHALGDPAKYPWCGDLVETCIRLGLPHEPFNGPLAQNPYWARNWLDFGLPVNPLNARGCVGVWPRGSGGHVGFIVGHDARYWYVDGGNQSNETCRVRIPKSRELLGARWPVTHRNLESLPVMDSVHVVSMDEA